MPHEIYIVLLCAVPSRRRAEERPSRVGAEAKEADAKDGTAALHRDELIPGRRAICS